MSNFSTAIKFVLRHEGYRSVDHAGLTIYGVTLQLLKQWEHGDLDKDGDIDIDDIRVMEKDNAKKCFKDQFWQRYSYWDIRVDNCATKVFDLAVNTGPRQAALFAQRALRACKKDIEEDGILGPKSRKQINLTNPHRFLSAICSEAGGFYRHIAWMHKDPKDDWEKKYLKGWLNRAYDLDFFNIQ